MAINFPSDAINNTPYYDVASGTTWKFDPATNSWSEVTTDLRPIISQDTPPDPVLEDYIWFNTDTGEAFTGYIDPSGDAYWVSLTKPGPPGPKGDTGDQGPTSANSPETDNSTTGEVGDVVYNSAPTAGGYIGWVCVVAGTPGTWKRFGQIES